MRDRLFRGICLPFLTIPGPNKGLKFCAILNVISVLTTYVFGLLLALVIVVDLSIFNPHNDEIR